jgi:serine phosphatase RsbU (regulator of sigma subunit)
MEANIAPSITLPVSSKILVIDDDPDLRQKIYDYLDDTGFSPILAENGAVGLELFFKEKPDLVLTDLQMPVLNGLEVLSKIVKEAPEMPIIVMSDESAIRDVIIALRIGSWDCLPKPLVSLPILEQAICKALERSRLMLENQLYRTQLEAMNKALKKSLDVLQEDQEAGRSVQMRLLPEQNIHFGSYVLTHSVNPSLYLSGDFIDCFKINDEKFGFYLADVSGHGASSAFVTILLKGLIEQTLTRYQMYQDPLILEPEKLLSRLSSEIYNAKLGKYLTMVYCVVDHVDQFLIYSIGGHYPNPILLDGNNICFLEGKGFPVGIMKQVTYQQYRMPLSEGIRLMILSDGITEILSDKDLALKEKTIFEMIKAADADITQLVKALEIEKKELPDDVTMLVLKRV